MLKRILHLFVFTAVLSGLFITAPVIPVYAADLTVNTLLDENDHSCLDADCSLRDAIEVASGGESIDFSVNGTIRLSSQLYIDKGLIINGPGVDLLAVSGDTDNNGVGNVRVFYLQNTTVTMSGLTILDGYTTNEGAGIYNNFSTLSLDDVKITKNIADVVGSSGGGVFNNFGVLTITNSEVSFNQSDRGAGVYSYYGAISLDHVIVSENEQVTANSEETFGGGMAIAFSTPVSIKNTIVNGNIAADGGGVSINSNSGGNITIQNSTFYGNTSTIYSGGGLSVNGDSIFNIKNVTISGNNAGYGGGLMVGGNVVVNMNNVTIADNAADSLGGGIFTQSGTSHIVSIKNTIIANNTGNTDGNDCYGTLISEDYNLIEEATCTINGTTTHNVTGQDPQLNDLALIGGYYVRTLQFDSPAYEAGNNATCEAFDQRGAPRPQGIYCDIGAFELERPVVASITRDHDNPTNSAFVDYTVTFSDTVSGVNMSDFALTTTGVTGAAITNVDNTDDVNYRVTVNTGSGNGTIRLDVIDDDSIIDNPAHPLGGVGTGNGNFISGEIYAVDHTAPLVTSVTRLNSDPTALSNVQFAVTFSEPVTGVNTDDFILTTSGVSGATVSGISGSDSLYTVTVDTGSGSGTIRLDVLDDDSIKDALLNSLGAGFTNGETYNINKTKMAISAAANDGWILESTETSGKGGAMNSTANNFFLGDDLADRQYRAILHFDTSSLPDNAVITSVTLKIKKQGMSGSNPFNILGGLQVDIRKPAFGNAALALTDFKSPASASNVGTFGFPPIANWYSATLNTTGQMNINLSGTTQLRLRFAIDDNNDNGNDFMKFFSGNAPAANRPQLIIDYNTP